MCGALLAVAAGIVTWIMPGHRDGAARKIFAGGHSTDIDGLQFLSERDSFGCNFL